MESRICRYDCGISQPTAKIRECDRERIINNFCLKFVILVAKAELDQLLEGLKSLDMLSLIRNYPASSQKLFLYVETGESYSKLILVPRCLIIVT